MMNDQEIRREALELAIRHADGDCASSVVVESAREFEAYLKGETK